MASDRSLITLRKGARSGGGYQLEVTAESQPKATLRRRARNEGEHRWPGPEREKREDLDRLADSDAQGRDSIRLTSSAS